MKGYLPIILLLVCFFSGCGIMFTPEQERQKLILHQLGPHLRCIPARSETLFAIEPMAKGYAAVVETKANPDDIYAYWVYEERVYAVNQTAAKCDPDLPAAPKEITYESVCKAIQEAEPNWKPGEGFPK